MGVSRRTVLLAGAGASGLTAVGALGATRRPDPTGASAPTALVAGSLLHVAQSLGGAAVEAHGSAAVRRLVVDGLKSPDAVALADPGLFRGIAGRATRFATNALVIAYDPESPHADALRRDWRSAIADPAVDVGRTDPDVDPLGYRTVMALELAERRSGVDADAVLDGSRVFRETDLLNVLEQGAIDAAFVYRNMAVERALPAVAFPDAIDFSAPAHADVYASVTYELPDGTVRGAPIRYAAAALTGRGEPWVEDLVTARDILEESGFTVPDSYPIRDVEVGEGSIADGA